MRFLFVDRILELSPGRLIRGIKHVTQDDFYLTCGDDGRPNFIPSLIGETLGQLAAWNVMCTNDFTMRPVAGIVSSAHLLRPVHVGDTIQLESTIDSLDESSVRYHSSAYVGSDEVFRIDSALGPMLPMGDFIDNETIRHQFNEIYRPGEHTVEIGDGTMHADDENGFIYKTKMVFDKIIDCVPGQSMVAEKLVSRSAPYFPDHFPRKPVLPMTVLLECKINLAKAFINRSNLDVNFEKCEMHRIKMSDFVLPGDSLITHLQVKRHDDDGLVLNFRSELDGKRVCVLDVVLPNSRKNHD
jgi:3-hydroxymyristoyl/3-hydroxydecanoyl-(acyl carrier protein) dehydratase